MPINPDNLTFRWDVDRALTYEELDANFNEIKELEEEWIEAIEIRDASKEYSELSQEWAENPEGVEITGYEGSYSSMHHALQSEESALAAAESETNAANSETAAATSESNASTSEQNAATSETNAAESEANALAYLEDYQGRWFGALESDPTEDPLGKSVDAGDAYLNTDSEYIRVYTGTKWIDAFATADGVVFDDTLLGLGVSTVQDALNKVAFKPSVKETLRANFAENDYALVERYGLEPKIIDNLMDFSRDSGSTRVNHLGLIEDVEPDIPRIDFDPITGECKGVLIEEQRTNLFTYSEQFDRGSWDISGATIKPNDDIGPDGSLTAGKLIEGDNDGGHSVKQTLDSSTDGDVYTFSVFAKAGERTKCRVTVSGTDIDNETFDADLSITEDTENSEYIGNGWHRIFVSQTSAGGDIVGTVYTLTDDNFYEGDGTSGIYIWGAQLEEGTFPTSYIPTRASFVSRDSTATYYDSDGVLQTAEVDEARYGYGLVNGRWVSKGLILEDQATNYLLDSDAPATQTVSGLSAGDYVLWIEGSGSVDVSGATDGDYGSATESDYLAFTVSEEQDVTVTVVDTVDRFQLENSAYPTSYIPTTDAQVTRNADVSDSSQETRVVDTLSRTIGMEYNYSEGTLYVEANSPDGETVVSVGTVDIVSDHDGVKKYTATYSSDEVDTEITFGKGIISEFKYWPKVLSETELQQLTK